MARVTRAPSARRSRCSPTRSCGARVDTSALPPLTKAVTERVIHASADLDYLTDLVCDEADAGPGAPGASTPGAPLIADSEMVAAGRDQPRACTATSTTRRAVGRPRRTTRSAAGIRLAFDELGPGAVWVIGNAPTALFELLELDAEPGAGHRAAGRVRRRRRVEGRAARVRPAGRQQRQREGRLSRRRGRAERACSTTSSAGHRRVSALLIAGHGTRTAAGVAEFTEFVKRVEVRLAEQQSRRRRRVHRAGAAAAGRVGGRPRRSAATGTSPSCRSSSSRPATRRATCRRRWPASSCATPGSPTPTAARSARIRSLQDLLTRRIDEALDGAPRAGHRGRRWSGAARPIPTATPRWPRSPGCSGRGAAST